MSESLCTYPLRSDLFAFAVHPTAAVLAIGLASGHVQLNCLPASPSPWSSDSSPIFPPTLSPITSQPIINTITTQWTTRRHKPSCRTLSFTPNGGLQLLSAGTDGLVKLADTSTGRVCSKIALPPLQQKSSAKIDQPTLVHALTPQCLLLATEYSALHLYDIRCSSPSSNSKISGPRIASKPAQTHFPHADYITSLISLTSDIPSSEAISNPNTTQFLSTGGTTVAITDFRRGVLVQSEDQGEELLASALCGDKVVVGGERGRLRVWQAGVWDDNEVVVDIMRGDWVGVESMAVVPKEEWEEKESKVAVGMEDGTVSFVEVGVGRKGKGARLRENEAVRHDEIEGVVGLGFVNGGQRMVTGGGAVVKVWEEGGEREGDDDNEYDDEEDLEEAETTTSNEKRRKINDDENGSGQDADAGDDSDEGSRRSRKKKRKRGKNKGQTAHQILGFKGLD